MNQLAAAEGLPRKSHGVYDIVACLRWYVQYLHQKIADRQKQDGGDTTSAAIRHKTLSIDAEIKQLELAKDREQLVSRDSVDKDFAALVVEIRTRARAVSPRIAHELLGETDLATAQVKIDAGLKRFLEELSQFDLDVV